jgi:hypothetical protein
MKNEFNLIQPEIDEEKEQFYLSLFLSIENGK